MLECTEWVRNELLVKAQNILKNLKLHLQVNEYFPFYFVTEDEQKNNGLPVYDRKHLFTKIFPQHLQKFNLQTSHNYSLLAD